MSNEKNTNLPQEDSWEQRPFAETDVEFDIGSDVESIMGEPAEEAALTDGATIFMSVDNTGRVAPEKPAEAPAATPKADSLYHALLSDPVVGEEITADETAIHGAGLVHPSDAEVERIISETKTDDKEDADTPATSDTLIFDSQEIPLIQDYVDPGTPEEPEEEPEPTPEEDPPLPKRRPRMKKGYGLLGIPHILATVVWLAITVAIGLSIGRMIWICAAEVLAFGRPDGECVVTITDADNIETVTTKLKNAGLIKYPELFKLYAELTDAEEELSPGTFTLNTKYDYHALVNAMTYHSTAREEVEVLIPEGYTCSQIFKLLEEKNVCTVEELELYAADGDLDPYWFLEDVPRGDRYCLEGYLFPDTYRFYTNDEPENVLEKFLDNFDARFTDIMKEKIEPLNTRMAAILAERGYSEEEIEARKFTLHKIITIASMIEKETANDSESYDVSSVIYNRLTNPAEYPFLNIDATIVYALDGNIDPETGKSMPLTSEDLQLDSPYNTYTVKGLIPGPISNPGRNSINAALDPNETSYYFYVYNPNTSLHIFSKTAEEHDKNVAYVRGLENQ